MVHSAKGNPKILKKCRLPLTAVKEVDLIVTEKAVIEVTDNGLILKEIAPGLSIEDILRDTEANLIISDDLKIMEL
jgi:acetate CoA/acetoacetate CoA-transferase beta subunit